jgi:hypothetical protein
LQARAALSMLRMAALPYSPSMERLLVTAMGRCPQGPTRTALAQQDAIAALGDILRRHRIR